MSGRRTAIVVSEEAGVRFLHFGTRWVQGAMRIARPYALELEYTRELMVPLLLRSGEGFPASVLQIGLGAASTTRFVAHHRPRARQTVVEHEQAVVDVAREHFRLPAEGPALRIEIADAYDWMHAGDATFDMIIVDGFDGQGRAGRLDSAAFYRRCRARLTRRGLLAANFIDKGRGTGSSIALLREVFGEGLLQLPRNADGNTVVLASWAGAIRISQAKLSDRALELRESTGLDLRPTIARLT